jgi:hypothetical protein
MYRVDDNYEDPVMACIPEETPVCPTCRSDVSSTSVNYAITPPDNEMEESTQTLRNKVEDALHHKDKAMISLANDFASFLVMKMEKEKDTTSLSLTIKYTWKEIEEWFNQNSITIPKHFRLNVLSIFFAAKEILRLPKRTLHVCTAPDVYELEIIP